MTAKNTEVSFVPFPCLPVQDFITALEKTKPNPDLSLQAKFWTPLLKFLDPQRVVELDSKNHRFLVIQKVCGKIWKGRINSMANAFGQQFKNSESSSIKKLKRLAPKMNAILCKFCKKYETLHYIPTFLNTGPIPDGFFNVFIDGYNDKRYLYLIFLFLKMGKDCSYFFTQCQDEGIGNKKDQVFQNEIFEYLLCLGIGSGIHIADLIKGGMDFSFLDRNGCSFVHFFLLKKKEVINFSNSKPSYIEKADPLQAKFPPIPLTEEGYAKELEALCVASTKTINAIYQDRTALDCAIENNYEKEEAILRKYDAKTMLQEQSREVIQEEDDDFVVL